MANVNDRDEKEADIARFLGREFNRARALALNLIPDLIPGSFDLPPDFYAGHTTALNAGLTPLLQGVFEQQALTMLDDFDFLGVEWGLVNEGAADWAKEYTFRLVTDLTDTSRRTLQKVIPQFFEEQLTQGQLREMLAPTFGPVRAEMIARTEVTRAASEGEQELARQLANEGIQMKPVHQTRNDEIVCPICGPRHDKEITPADEYPPLHPRCLPGTSLVFPIGGVTAGSKRWYEGNVVTISTFENQLTVTPNHPILTDCGWVSAGELVKGDYVFGNKTIDERKSLFVEIDIDQMVSSIEDIFGALDINGFRVPVAAPDFHNDGVGSDVAVIRPNSKVMNNLEGNSFEIFTEHKFVGRDIVSLASLPGLCPSHKFVVGNITAASSLVSGLDLAPSLFGGHSGPLGSFRLALSSWFDARIQQLSSESASAYSDFFSQSIFGFTGLISLQEVIDIRNDVFSGHVYNLQTESGLYVADGIITHNCRCWVTHEIIPLP